jgi:hypothetical protein
LLPRAIHTTTKGIKDTNLESSQIKNMKFHVTTQSIRAIIQDMLAKFPLGK